jgi:hypothetical protein
MSTVAYKGYTLNGYLNTPSYDTEIALLKDMIDTLPTRGTTSVTTQHHHSRLSSPTADVNALSVGESGVLSAPLMLAGIMQVNADKTVGATGIQYGNLPSPGNARVVFGGITGLNSSANLLYTGGQLVMNQGASTATGIVGTDVLLESSGNVGASILGKDGSTVRVSLGDNNNTKNFRLESVASTSYPAYVSVQAIGATMMSFDYSVGGVRQLLIGSSAIDVCTQAYTGYSASVTGCDVFASTYRYKTLGKTVETMIFAYGDAVSGAYCFRVSLPVAAHSDYAGMYFFAHCTEGSYLTSGVGKVESGCTGIILYTTPGNESGMNGWTGNTGTRAVRCTLRYQSI